MSPWVLKFPVHFNVIFSCQLRWKLDSSKQFTLLFSLCYQTCIIVLEQSLQIMKSDAILLPFRVAITIIWSGPNWYMLTLCNLIHRLNKKKIITWISRKCPCWPFSCYDVWNILHRTHLLPHFSSTFDNLSFFCKDEVGDLYLFQNRGSTCIGNKHNCHFSNRQNDSLVTLLL